MSKINYFYIKIRYYYVSLILTRGLYKSIGESESSIAVGRLTTSRASSIGVPPNFDI